MPIRIKGELLTNLVSKSSYERAEKPRCLNEISHVTAIVGRTAFLPCLVQGNPLPTYEWRKLKDQTLLPLGSRFVPSRKGLVIQDINKRDDGKYQVKLENRVTNHHSAVTLHVKVIDVNFLEGRQLKNVSVNSSVCLSCGKRSNHTTTIRWIDSLGNDVTNSKRYSIHGNGSLIISPTKSTDSGEYVCKNTTNSYDGSFTTSLKWYLNIRYGPEIMTIKPLVSLVQNRDILLPCVSIGNPTPRIQWIFPNGTRVQDNKNFKTFDNGSLLIYNVTKRDGLNYSCRSWNGIGPPERGYTYLQVFFPPKFLSYPETNIIISKGHDAVLNCTSSAIPKPSTSWRHLKGRIKVEIPIFDETFVIKNETLVIKNTQIDDAGDYICIVKSRIGELNRTFTLRVKEKPSIPTNFAVKLVNNDVSFTWAHPQDEGLKSNFELWYRSESQTDFEWKTLTTIHTFLDISLKKIIQESSVSQNVGSKSTVLYFSVRATNSEGFSEFAQVIQISPSLNNSRSRKLSDIPLKPYNFTANFTDGRYTLKWRYIYTPGRPRALRFLVEYLEGNNTSIWKPVPKHGRVQRSITSANSESRQKTIVFMGDTQLLKFRIYSVAAGNKRSKPTIVSVQGGPTFIGNISPKKEETDIIPPLILGVIFILFFLILIISLYCFCRRKKRKSQGRDNCNVGSFKTKSELILDTCSMEFDDESKLFAPKIEMDSPARFHVAMCPALKLGKCSKRNDVAETPIDKRHSDDVYFLLEPHPKEKATCKCNQSANTKETKVYDKLKYKTSTPTGSLSSARSSVVVPCDGFNDEDYISDINKDCVTELDIVRTQVLKRFKFKDSYDQFCRPDGNDFPLNVCARVDLSVLEKTEVDKNMDVNGIDDSSSENSAPESERRMKLKEDDYNCNTKIFDIENISKFEECNSSSSDPDSISFLKLKKATTGIPANPVHYDYTHPKGDQLSKRDIGCSSDNTPRISPLFVTSQRYHPSQKMNIFGRSANYFSEDDTLTQVSPSIEYRAKQPPPTYNQAIIDIERMSDRNDVTDSEEMYDKLLRMEKQLGVQLSDSLDSDLNTRTLPSNYRQQHSKNSSDTGYISDIQVGSSKDRYTYREKSARCAQLLSEFKSSKSDGLQLMGEITDSTNDTSNSIVCEIAETPDVAPILKRSSSSTSNGTHNEWLV